jgi:hypothetical protein
MIDNIDLVTDIINHKNVNNNIYKLLEVFLQHVNINGTKIDINRCIVVDILYSNISKYTY